MSKMWSSFAPRYSRICTLITCLTSVLKFQFIIVYCVRKGRKPGNILSPHVNIPKKLETLISPVLKRQLMTFTQDHGNTSHLHLIFFTQFILDSTHFQFYPELFTPCEPITRMLLYRLHIVRSTILAS